MTVLKAVVSDLESLIKGQVNYPNSCFIVRLRWIFPILNSTISRSNVGTTAVQMVICKSRNVILTVNAMR